MENSERKANVCGYGGASSAHALYAHVPLERLSRVISRIATFSCDFVPVADFLDLILSETASRGIERIRYACTVSVSSALVIKTAVV